MTSNSRTKYLLKSLDSAKYNPDDLYVAPEAPKIVSALKHLLMPLQVIDTPRRAIISGVREIVDAMDTDPNTNASFGDFLEQTKDFHYGTGKAFPMKGWAGRIVGLVGDVALDPLTWATLGGTVVAKNTIKVSGASLAHLVEGGIEKQTAEQLAKLGVKNLGDDLYETSARKALFGFKDSGRAAAKSVIGREGREKLAFFTQQRMEWMNRTGLKKFTKDEIASAYKNIAAQGKQALPEIMAKELGIRGPGVYYFGSRVKIPGSDVVGKFLERGITKTRLGLVNTSGIGALHKTITPRGVGAIEYFGEGTIKRYRVALANGSLSNDEAQLARFILNGDDVRRIAYSEADHNALQLLGDLHREIQQKENNPVRHLLDNVESGQAMIDKAAELGISPEHLDLAQRFRAKMEELHGITDEGWRGIVPDHVLGYQKGYLPHNSTERFVELMQAIKDDPTKAHLLPDDGSALHIVGNFRQRGLKAGDFFFDTKLTQEDLTIDKLNAIVRNWLASTKMEPFDAFSTDMADIVPAYLRGHANMMSNVGMMQEFKKNPDFVKYVDGYLGVAPEYISMMHKDSALAWDNLLKSIQNMHIGLRNSLDQLKKVATSEQGGIDAALQAMKNPVVSQADVDELLGHLNRALADSAVKQAEVARLEAVIPTMMPNTDGFDVYARHAVQSDELQKRFEALTEEGLLLRSERQSSLTSQVGVKMIATEQGERVQKFLADFEKYTDDIGKHAKAQERLMEMSSFMLPLTDFSVYGSSNFYAQVSNVVKKLGKDVPATPVTRAVHTLEQIDDTLVRLGESGSRDQDVLLPILDSLRTHISERFPELKVKVNEVMNEVLSNAGKPVRRVKTEREILSLDKAAKAAKERLAVSEAKLAKATDDIKKVERLNLEIESYVRDIDAIKERLKWERTAYKKAMKHKYDVTGTELAPRERLASLAEARLVLTEVENQQKELYASMRSAKKELEVTRGPVDMGKARVDSRLQEAQAGNKSAIKEFNLRNEDHTKALQEVEAKGHWTSDYGHALEKARVLVAQQKTSDEVAHLREVFAYYGVDLGDSITQDVFQKNITLIAKGKDFGRFADDAISTKMEIVNLQKVYDDMGVRLNEALKTPKKGKAVAPRATKVVDPETARANAETELNDLLQSAQYALAKSDKNRVNSLIVLSQINGYEVDWTLGGLVRPPRLEAELAMGGENLLGKRLNNRTFWNKIFTQHEQTGPIATAITDWAHSDEVLQRTNGAMFRKSQLDGTSISHEASLRYLVTYLTKDAEDVGFQHIAGEEIMKARRAPIDRWWKNHSSNKLMRKEMDLRAIVVAKPIEDATATEIAAAQELIGKNIEHLKAYENTLKSEALQAAADEVYVPTVLDDAFTKLQKEYAGLNFDKDAENALIAIKGDETFGSAVDEEINLIAPQKDNIVDYRKQKQIEGELGYVRGETGSPDENISPSFEKAMKRKAQYEEAIDNVIVHIPIEAKSENQLRHELDVLQKLQKSGLETVEIKSKNIRTMIKLREDALGIERTGRSLQPNGLPTVEKIKMKPRRFRGRVVVNESTNQVVMEPDIKPSVIGSYRRFDDGSDSGRLFLRKEDMTAMAADQNKYWNHAKKDFPGDKWVEVRYRPITANDTKGTVVFDAVGRVDDEATAEARMALGWFEVFENNETRSGASRWLKSVEYGDEQWAGSTSEYGFSYDQANSFGGVVTAREGDDTLGVASKLEESIFTDAPPKPMTASEKAVEDLQRELRSISSSALAADSTKVQKKWDSYKAQKLVVDLQEQFDAVKGLAVAQDPAVIRSLEARVLQVRNMIADSQRSSGWGPNIKVKDTTRTKSKVGGQYYTATRPNKAGRAEVRARTKGQGWRSNQYNAGMKTLDEGIDMLRTMGTRGPGFKELEAIAARQVVLETEFQAAVARLGETEAEQRLLAGLQNSILTLEKSGRVVNSSDLEMGRFAESNVKKFFPDLEGGWEYLSKGIFGADGVKGDYGIYPGLAGSKEFVELWNQAQRFDDPAYLRQMHKYVGDYTKFFKAYATMTPGFHVRNGLANAVKLVFMGAEWNNMMEATPLYIDWNKAARAGVKYEEWVLTKPVDIQESLRIARKSMFGSGGGIFTADFKDAARSVKGRKSVLWDNKLVRFNAKWGQESDNYSRFVLGYDSARSGMDLGMAQARTKRAFFDYEDLSQVDEVMRQVVPFWLWTSRNLIFELQNQWLNPKPYQIYNSIMRNMRDPDYEPSEYPSPFVREIGGIKLPFGDNLYLAPDLGFTRTKQQLNELLDPVRYTNNLNPLLKIPLEEFLGKQVFTGKKLENSQDRLIHILKGFVPPVQMGDRLIGSEGDAAKNAWLSSIGSPIRTYKTKEK